MCNLGLHRRTAVILNPRSANSRTIKRWPVIKRAISNAIGDFTLLETKEQGHATVLTRNALKDGFEYIISVGGDGTHSEVINGFFEERSIINPDAILSVLPQGTGSDLARTLGISANQPVTELLSGSRILKIDVGRATFTSDNDVEYVRYFINVAHIGMGGAVADLANHTTKMFGGFVSYLWSVVCTLMTYKNTEINLDIDGEKFTQHCRDIIIGNGRYDGGGILVAPKANLENGTFDIYIMGDINRLQAIRDLPKLYKGKLMERADMVRNFKASRLTACSDERTLVNLDGEMCGTLPVTIEIVPHALNLSIGNCNTTDKSR